MIYVKYHYSKRQAASSNFHISHDPRTIIIYPGGRKSQYEPYQHITLFGKPIY